MHVYTLWRIGEESFRTVLVEGGTEKYIGILTSLVRR